MTNYTIHPDGRLSIGDKPTGQTFIDAPWGNKAPTLDEIEMLPLQPGDDVLLLTSRPHDELPQIITSEPH